MFASNISEGVESFFELLESFIIEARFLDGALEQASGFLRVVERTLKRVDDGLQDLLGELFLLVEQRECFFQQAFCARADGVFFCAASQRCVRERQGLLELFCVVEQVLLGFQVFFFVLLGVQGIQFLDGVSGELFVLGCLLGLLLRELVLFARALCLLPSLCGERA